MQTQHVVTCQRCETYGRDSGLLMNILHLQQGDLW